jgi:3-oxoacyl-[acyl-carrier-protein] synthase-1
MSAMMVVQATGLVTSTGNSAAATCAAIRAKVSNPSVTRFRGNQGDWLMAHQVQSMTSLRGVHKLSAMAALAIAECIAALKIPGPLPLLLCVAEADRPGRLPGIEDDLVPLIERRLGIQFDRTHSCVLSAGRLGALIALARAREILAKEQIDHVVIAATDSLLVAGTLAALSDQGRILTEENPDGFMPGEGAGAVLIGRAQPKPGQTVCLGYGESMETAPILSAQPLRALGLKSAIRQALTDAGDIPFEAIDVRISDVSGEQYGFKEAALAVGSLLRVRRENQDLWHPAEVVGEIGSAIGPVMIAVATDGVRNGMLTEAPILLHAGADDGRRAAWLISKLRELQSA